MNLLSASAISNLVNANHFDDPATVVEIWNLGGTSLIASGNFNNMAVNFIDVGSIGGGVVKIDRWPLDQFFSRVAAYSGTPAKVKLYLSA